MRGSLETDSSSSAFDLSLIGLAVVAAVVAVPAMSELAAVDLGGRWTTVFAEYGASLVGGSGRSCVGIASTPLAHSAGTAVSASGG